MATASSARLKGCAAPTALRLLDLDEAQRVRALGWRGPILLLEGVFELRDLELCSRLDLWHTVHCDEQIDMLATHKTNVPHRVFLKMNSGMNRLGFTPQRYRAAWTRLNALPQVDEISLMTHFSDADGATGVAAQMAIFASVTRDLPGERTVSNSAATLRFPVERGAGQRPPGHAGRLRLGSPRHCRVWQRARLPRAQRRPLGPAAGHDA